MLALGNRQICMPQCFPRPSTHRLSPTCIHSFISISFQHVCFLSKAVCIHCSLYSDSLFFRTRRPLWVQHKFRILQYVRFYRHWSGFWNCCGRIVALKLPRNFHVFCNNTKLGHDHIISQHSIVHRWPNDWVSSNIRLQHDDSSYNVDRDWQFVEQVFQYYINDWA